MKIICNSSHKSFKIFLLLSSAIWINSCSWFSGNIQIPKPQENPYFSIKNADIIIQNEKPVWRIDILWKKTSTGRLKIQDKSYSYTILETNADSSTTRYVSKPISPEDPNYNWLFRKGLASQKTENQIEARLTHDNKDSHSVLFLTRIPEETKQSLYYKFKHR